MNPELISCTLKAAGLEFSVNMVLLNYAMHANHEGIAALDPQRVADETSLGLVAACATIEKCVQLGFLAIVSTLPRDSGVPLNVMRVNGEALKRIARRERDYGDDMLSGQISFDDEGAQG